MPLIQPQMAVPLAEVRPLLGSDRSPAAQGADGRRLQEQWDDVLRHWYSRSNGLFESLPEVFAEYRHVPFRTVGTVRVTYGQPERLRPRRIVLDDDAS